jgi:GNAT superfamily N-acetyltransferase
MTTDAAAPMFQPLLDADVPAALRLSTQAGWNQTAADWRRLLTGWPRSCLGGYTAGLVATGTLATFATAAAAPTGWIGMILVDDCCRGRGHGGAMMRELLRIARSMGLAGVGLDATDLGRPVYEKLGFVPHAGLSRWMRTCQPAEPDAAVGPGIRPLSDEDWPAITALDVRGVGVERLPLLRPLATEPGATAVVAVERGRPVAFGFSRPGRTARAIGPVVADTAEAAAAVTRALLASASDAAILIDMPDGSPLEPLVQAAGFSVTRRVTRMLLPLESAPATLVSPRVHAVVSFELG